jgi:hypothetical protein
MPMKDRAQARSPVAPPEVVYARGPTLGARARSIFRRTKSRALPERI